VQFDADPEQFVQLSMHFLQVQVELSAKNPVNPLQLFPQLFPFKYEPLLQERQVVEVVLHEAHGLLHCAQTPELL
jgi:hypothetical protein